MADYFDKLMSDLDDKYFKKELKVEHTNVSDNNISEAIVVTDNAKINSIKYELEELKRQRDYINNRILKLQDEYNAIAYNSVGNPKVNVLPDGSKEFARRCNVCGKIYCYTDSDTLQNSINKGIAVFNGVTAIANVIGGTMLGAYVTSNQSDKFSNRVVDYNKCPSCGSRNTRLITDNDIDFT